MNFKFNSSLRLYLVCLFDAASCQALVKKRPSEIAYCRWIAVIRQLVTVVVRHKRRGDIYARWVTQPRVAVLQKGCTEMSAHGPRLRSSSTVPVLHFRDFVNLRPLRTKAIARLLWAYSPNSNYFTRTTQTGRLTATTDCGSLCRHCAAWAYWTEKKKDAVFLCVDLLMLVHLSFKAAFSVQESEGLAEGLPRLRLISRISKDRSQLAVEGTSTTHPGHSTQTWTKPWQVWIMAA